jgi:hypothetical protein
MKSDNQKEAVMLLLLQQHHMTKTLAARVIEALDDPKNKNIPVAVRMQIEATLAGSMAAILGNDFRFLEASQERMIWTPQL